MSLQQFILCPRVKNPLLSELCTLAPESPMQFSDRSSSNRLLLWMLPFVDETDGEGARRMLNWCAMIFAARSSMRANVKTMAAAFGFCW